MAGAGAAELGARLLAEVKEERLDELLYSLRGEFYDRGKSQCWLGIPALDRMVHAFQRQRLADIRPAVVEITSVAPASGKTHLLYTLTAAAVLPKFSNESKRPRGCLGCAAVFDADNRFDVDRLAQVMYHRLGSSVSHEQGMAMIRNALHHVHIFRPQSLASLVATVRDLPSYFFHTGSHHSGDRSLDLVIIDSVSGFFWQERLAEETALLEAATEGASRHSSKYVELVSGLRQVQRLFGCSVVAASWGLAPSSSSSSSSSAQIAAVTATNYYPSHALSFRPLLPAAWQAFCTLRLVVARDPVRHFPADMSLEQAKREAGDRQMIVDQGRFTAWVDEWNCQTWSSDVCEFLKSSPHNRAFSFQINPEGVFVADENQDALGEARWNVRGDGFGSLV